VGLIAVEAVAGRKIHAGGRMRYAQLVIGPAGSGKSTYCSYLAQHCETIKRTVHVVNLDPAAEVFTYPVDLDVRDLISVNDVMEDEELKFGPNGGLVFCMEYLLENLEWLEEGLGDYDDDYYIFDCPGQIELYTHIPVMKKITEFLQQHNFRICSVFLLDAQFLTDVSKFFAGVMTILAAMIQLEVPHISVLSKLDLIHKKDKKNLDRYLDPNPDDLQSELSQAMNKKYKGLNKALASLVMFSIHYVRISMHSILCIKAAKHSVNYCSMYSLLSFSLMYNA
jgi:GTPase SAR1 family protein